MTKYKILLIIIISFFFFLFLPLAVGFGKTGENTSVLGKDYSYLNKSAIISRLQTDFPLPDHLLLHYQDRNFSLSTASVSANLNFDQIASTLLFRRLKSGLVNYIRSFFIPKYFVLEVDFDSLALDSEIQKIISQINQPFIPSELLLENQKIIVRNGQVGREVDPSSLRQQIINSLVSYKFDSIAIPVTQVGSLPTESQVTSTINSAKNILGKNLTLLYDNQKILLNDQILVGWFGFGSPCFSDKINQYVDNLSPSISHSPVDAVFKFENGRVTDFQSAKDGYQLQLDDTKTLLCQSLTNLSSSSEKSLSVNLPLSFTSPKIKNSDVNNLGIKELLGRGVSSFRHSSTIRNFNVEKGASIVNRILVAPGEEFSFLAALGDVSLEAGYKKAYVIKKGKTELDVGGGICQVSTTFFRAILDAGLDVTQRKAHAYRVSYYEEDSKPGFDATVFIPNPDLRFKNDTSHHLLIQSQYDGVNKKLVYEIYGTSDGRAVEISNYRQWGAAPAPPDIWIDDPTLPPGKIVKDESAVPGLKTAFDWKVTRNGEILHQRNFQSSYVPWAAVYRRGPAQ